MGLFSSGIRKNMKKRIDSYQPMISVMGFFKQSGIPIADQLLLGLMLCEDKIIIVDQSHEFIIKLPQVQNVKYDVEREIEKETKTSTAKGLIGGALFGPAGAVVGSQPKEKIVSNTTISSLTISYINSKGEDSRIEFVNRTFGGKTPYEMKAFERKVNEIINKNKIPDSGSIEL